MKLIFSLFSRRLFLNILVALQICASVVFGMIALSVMQNYRFYYDVTSSLSDSYFYSPGDEASYYDENSAVIRYLNDEKIELSRVQTNSWLSGYDPTVEDPLRSWLNCDYTLDNIYIVGPAVSEMMSVQLKSGRWFTDGKEDGVIECVIVGDERLFPIGTVLDLGEFRFVKPDEDSSEPGGYVIANKVRLRVVGSCGTSAEALEMSAWTTPPEAMELSMLFESLNYGSDNFFESLSAPYKSSSDSDDKPELSVICSSAAMYDSVIGAPENASSVKRAVFSFTENVTEQEKQQIIAEMKNEASVIAVETLRENQLKAFNATLLQYLPLLMCFTVLVVVGVIGSAILNMSDNRRVFQSCFICGMSVRQGCLSVLAYTCILLTVAAMLTVVSWTLLSVARVVPWAQMYFNGNCVLLAVAVFVLSALLMFIVSVRMLKKYFSDGAEI